MGFLGKPFANVSVRKILFPYCIFSSCAFYFFFSCSITSVSFHCLKTLSKLPPTLKVCFIYFLFYMYVCSAWIYFCASCGNSLRRLEGIRFPGTGCEWPCRCWELNLEPLAEQSVLSTTEPSLQPPTTYSLLL